MTLSAYIEETRTKYVRIAPADISFRFISADAEVSSDNYADEVQLNLVPAIFAVGMLFAAVVLGVAANAAAVVFLAGTAAAAVVSVFAFVSLYAVNSAASSSQNDKDYVN
ncbi:hypothetical protein RQN30_08705 [Arcanobacterium hippocoleae]